MLSKMLKRRFNDIKNFIPIIFVSLLMSVLIDFFYVYLGKSIPRINPFSTASGRHATMERRMKRIELYRRLSRWLLWDNKEGYETYSNCIKQGYPNNFCLHVPVEACINNCNLKKWKPKY